MTNITNVHYLKIDNPFEKIGLSFLDNMPIWVGFVFGSIFIIMGIVIWTLIAKTKRNADEYKQNQLNEYNRNHNSNETEYENTKLYLPFTEKMKLYLPTFLGLTFIIVGIAWLVGNTLTSL